MTKRVLLGKFPDGGYGLRISDPDYDVTSNPVDNERLIFNSDWPAVLPIYAMGQASINNSSTTISYPDLGYVPHLSALVNINSEGWHWLSHTAVWNNIYSEYNYRCLLSRYSMKESDTTGNITIKSKRDCVYLSSSFDIQIKYFVYRMRAFTE